MPYAARPNYYDPNDPKNNQNGVNISGGGGADFSSGVPGQETSSQKDRKSSGSYANIQSYLDANKDQGDQMGQRLASDVGAKAEDATQKITSYESKAPTVAAYDPNEAYQNVTNLSDEQKQNYQTQKTTGGYSGPQSADRVDGYADAQKATSGASTAVKSAGTEFGQQQLLKDTYKRPSYTAGENRLDQALVQGSAGSKQALEGVTNKYKDLDNYFNTASSNVGTAINNANTQALANKNAIVAGEAQQWKNLVDPIQARADQMNVDNPAKVQAIQNDLSDFNLDEETMAMLGLNEGQKIYGLKLGQYVTPDFTQVGLNNAANADERAKYLALQSLTGDQTRNQIDANGKAINPITFNQDQYSKDLAQAQAEFERNAASSMITGSGRESFDDIDYSSADASGSVADYLAGRAPTYTDTENGIFSSIAGAREKAKQNWTNLVLQYLQNQGYNNVIKKNPKGA